MGRTKLELSINIRICLISNREAVRGSFSWYIYSPLRVKYPYVRGVLINLWREALQAHQNPLDAWKAIVENPEKAKSYKQARGKGGFVRAECRKC